MTFTNYMEAALAPGEAVYKRGVIHDTFGHLAPQADVTYTGYILFAYGCCGDITVIDWRFTDAEGNDLDGSPWISEDIDRVIGDMVLPPGKFECELPEGHVFRFRGTYTRSPDRPTRPGSSIMREGRGRFKGKLRRIHIAR